MIAHFAYRAGMLKIVQTTVCAILCAATPAFSERTQLLESGSFEWPPVRRKKAISEGADVSKSAMNAEWLTFKDSATGDGGKLVLGLTNEQFRTGKQCMFVQFDHLTRPAAVAQLASDFVSIKPGESYHVSIWGRVDKKEPLTLDQRVPHIRLRVDWFLADKEEQTGNVEYRTQPIPGTANRPPMFSAAKWSEYFANLKSPPDAAFMRVTWTWETPPQPGETHGIVYFDDATIIGESGPKEDPFAEEPETATDDAKSVEKPEPTLQPKQEQPGENLAAPVSTPIPAPPSPRNASQKK